MAIDDDYERKLEDPVYLWCMFLIYFSLMIIHLTFTIQSLKIPDMRNRYHITISSAIFSVILVRIIDFIISIMMHHIMHLSSKIMVHYLGF